MILKLVEDSAGISLSYPAWLPLLCLGLAAACAWTAALRPSMWGGPRWRGFVVTALLAWVGLHFGGYQGRFTPVDGRINAPFRSTVAVSWSEVSGIRRERSRSKGRIGFVLVASTSRGEFEFNVADLDTQQLDRLTRYIEQQIASSRRAGESGG